MNHTPFARKQDLLWLLLPVICIAVLLLRAQSDTPVSAQISIGDEVVAVYPLSEPQTITLANADGIRIEIRENAVCVLESDCPDKRCVRMGTISKPGEMIVCLPHAMIITLVGASDGADVVIG